MHRAMIIDPKQVPEHVITMNSTAAMVDRETMETVVFTLVGPAEATFDDNTIAVLAPIAAVASSVLWLRELSNIITRATAKEDR